MKDSHDLSLVFDSKVPIVIIETFDEKRALDMLLKVANARSKTIFRWSVTDGLARMSFGPHVVKIADHTEPKDLLQHVKDVIEPGIYVMCDFHHYLKDEPINIRLIKDIAQNHHSVPNIMVFLSHQFEIPPELSRYSAVFQMSLPSDEEIMSIVRDEAKHWSEANGGSRVKTDSETIGKLVANLKGLSHAEVRRLARGAIIDDGAITDDDIPEVNKAKFQLMDMEGVLSFEYNTQHFSDVGGLNNLKLWLEQRRSAFFAEEKGKDLPKGIMLVGVQGGGKSLAAKGVAGLWGVPLLRLDFGALYNKFFGESERNLREALNLADVMSPCVLWLDEIEKGVSQGDSDNGTSQRILGTLLTWMAERKKPVFMVATSNDISRLPPELVRKGRLDEIFFVDLPDQTTRVEIFSIHLNKRGRAAENFDLELLARTAEGFSGAEIEQAVVSAIYGAAALEVGVNEQQIVEQICNTSPLSVVMSEKVNGLRLWAKDRTVSAN